MSKIMYKGKEYGGDTNHASELNYDNSSSGLSATNTQEAIDEVNAKVKDAVTDVSIAQGTILSGNVVKPNKLNLTKGDGSTSEVDMTHYHTANEIYTTPLVLESNGVVASGGQSTVSTELSRLASNIMLLNSFQATQSSTNANVESRLTELEAVADDIGKVLIAYKQISTTSQIITDTNDWKDYKAFVVGLECTGDGPYVTTRYIPADFIINFTGNNRHVLDLDISTSSTEYKCTAIARFYPTTQEIVVAVYKLMGLTNPRFFVYGVK